MKLLSILCNRLVDEINLDELKAENNPSLSMLVLREQFKSIIIRTLAEWLHEELDDPPKVP